MIDLEQELTTMLHDRASKAEARPDLQDAMSDTRLVRLDTTTVTAGPVRARVAAVVAVAAVMLAATVLTVSIVQRNETQTVTDVAEPPPAGLTDPSPGALESRFPVLGDLPDSFDTDSRGAFAIPDPANPLGTTALVGRRSAQNWTAVSRVTASDTRPDSRLVQGIEVVVGEITATRISEGPTVIYIWEVDGIWITVDTPLPEPGPLLAAVRILPGGPADLGFENLPEGIEILAEPSALPTEPAPVVSANESPRPEGGIRVVAVETIPGGLATAVGTGDFDLVDINGQPGLVSQDTSNLYVAWVLDENHTAVLTANSFTPSEIEGFARDVTFVDEATWERTYEISGPALLPTTTTTIVVPDETPISSDEETVGITTTTTVIGDTSISESQVDDAGQPTPTTTTLVTASDPQAETNDPNRATTTTTIEAGVTSTTGG